MFKHNDLRILTRSAAVAAFGVVPVPAIEIIGSGPAARCHGPHPHGVENSSGPCALERGGAGPCLGLSGLSLSGLWAGHWCGFAYSTRTYGCAGLPGAARCLRTRG